MVLALDIGGTYIRIAEVKGCKVKKRLKVKTPKNKQKILDKIVKLISSFDNEGKIGVSIAGFVKGGKIIKSPHIALNNFNLKIWLMKKLCCNVFVENDAKCAGMAENKFGHGKRYKNYIFLTLGTGIGGAIFIDGKLYRGAGFAGEFGHTKGGKKEFEDLASGKTFDKIEKRYGAKIAIDKITDSLAEGIDNIVYSFDPQAIILGGGLSGVPEICKLTSIKLKKKDMIHRKTPILRSKLGDDAGLIGAALLKEESS